VGAVEDGVGVRGGGGVVGARLRLRLGGEEKRSGSVIGREIEGPS